MQNRLRFANLPDGFKDMELRTFRKDIYKLEQSRKDIDLVVGIIKLYLSEIEKHKANGKGLYIYSRTKGSGKTRLAVSIANELMKNRDTPVKFAVATQILNEIRATWHKDSEYTESKLLDALSTTEVLIIDDFGGTEQVKDWVNDKYYSIINERYINKKVTIFTSNNALQDLEYNDRIVNRIKEMVFIIPFPEESVRDYIAEEQNNEMINKIMGVR